MWSEHISNVTGSPVKCSTLIPNIVQTGTIQIKIKLESGQMPYHKCTVPSYKNSYIWKDQVKKRTSFNTGCERLNAMYIKAIKYTNAENTHH